MYTYILEAFNLVSLARPLHSWHVTVYSLTYTAVVHHTRISYCTRMIHTIRVYAYDTTVRVWYGYLYHMCIATIPLQFTSNI